MNICVSSITMFNEQAQYSMHYASPPCLCAMFVRPQKKDKKMSAKFDDPFCLNRNETGQVSFGDGAGAVGRRVHLAMVLLRPPSGHRPNRRQARHARILQIGLRLAITQTDARPVMSISFR